MDKTQPPSYESLYGKPIKNNNLSQQPIQIYYSYPSYIQPYAYKKKYKNEDNGLICCRLL